MKTAYLLILVLFSFSVSVAQEAYWQQQLRYDIDVRLNDSAKTLDGYLKLNYRNNSPDTLDYIWFHLWPNAFKNDRTAFSDQMLENGSTEFYFSDNNKRGYLNRLDFRIEGEPLKTEDHPYYIDILKVILSKPLPPGNEILITTPFHVQLSYNFSRGGYYKKTFQVTQWYPKPAVYDKNGWHEMPYLNQGEFYGEFGSYRVEITIPELYKIAATGMQDTADQQKQPVETGLRSEEKLKTFIYQQDSVHDFAWFADKNFIIKKDTVLLRSGRIIQCQLYYHENSNGSWNTAMQSLKKAILLHSDWIGEYPYPVVSVVDGKMDFEGGMEYPTITIINPGKGAVDELIFHEVGHNWFYGILGTNERTYPWMDEGLNSFYDLRYADGGNENNSGTKKSNSQNKIGGLNYRKLGKLGYQLMASLDLDQPIDTPADSLTAINASAISYLKTADWLSELEQRIGRTSFDKAMQNYYEKWKFKHPYPDDLKKALQESNTQDLNAWYQQKDSTGFLTKPGKRPFKVAAFIRPNIDREYNYLFIAPVLGFNYYDGLMAGLLLHNYTVPFSRFQFALAPMFGFKSKKPNGIGRASYRWNPQKTFQQVEVFLNAAKFTIGDFTDDGGNRFRLAYSKLVPGFRLEFKEKSARSTMMKYISFKQFLIQEEELGFYRDTVQQINLARKVSDHFGISQLSIGWDQFRKLYPNNGELRMEANGKFGRVTFTGNYYFNYKKKGGINLRLFAGKFFYFGEKTSSEQFASSRFHLNMTGPKGDEDYTYNNYFAGRNEFTGVFSQQIMMRDGAFKVRTDMLSSKIGKTDNWLTAFNLTVDIPDKMNPLSLLPVEIPVRIFADAGTYADVWEKDATDPRVVFDAGLQISLLWSSLNIYIPLVYSNVYKDYYKSVPGNNFWNRISFSIDVPIIQPKKFLTSVYSKLSR